jgi:hypothetical protein
MPGRYCHRNGDDGERDEPNINRTEHIDDDQQ